MRRLSLCLLVPSLLSLIVNVDVQTPNLLNHDYERLTNSESCKIWNADWVATDDLGRVLPNYQEIGPVKDNKYVGIFYFLWHGVYRDRIYDVTKILKRNPGRPVYGPVGSFHWWGEPEANYYRSDDPWIIRRNLQMLTNAGIDILFMDVTNRDTYLNNLRALCSVSAQMRKQGYKTPYICFVTHHKTAETVNELYTNFYAKNQYADLWFIWHGKPLILGKKEEVTAPIQQNFFTWRYSWQFTDSKNNPGHWQWLDNTPQNYGWVESPDVPEQISVAVASHPVFGVGKSNVKGLGGSLNKLFTTTGTATGGHFKEQWQRAFDVNPNVIFVTGWNEWIAQRFVADTNDRSQVFKYFIDHKLRQGETFFQDEYNEEFNRDIEPMRGGYSDNYYYQLVANVRRFKGTNVAVRYTLPKTISIDGNFTDWETVQPVFKDWVDDVLHRNWFNYDKSLRLINNTGRNDIIEARIIYDNNFLYSFAKTNERLTPADGPNWMLLFIDIDQSRKTGWQGYDYVINKVVKKDGTTSIHRWVKNNWQPIGKASFMVSENKIEIKIPRVLLKLKGSVSFDFHWADNIQRWNSITDFFLNGDSAPDRRFNYRYSYKKEKR